MMTSSTNWHKRINTKSIKNDSARDRGRGESESEAIMRNKWHILRNEMKHFQKTTMTTVDVKRRGRYMQTKSESHEAFWVKYKWPFAMSLFARWSILSPNVWCWRKKKKCENVYFSVTESQCFYFASFHRTCIRSKCCELRSLAKATYFFSRAHFNYHVFRNKLTCNLNSNYEHHHKIRRVFFRKIRTTNIHTTLYLTHIFARIHSRIRLLWHSFGIKVYVYQCN